MERLRPASEIAEEIRRIRKNHFRTQGRFAEALGSTQQMVSAWEQADDDYQFTLETLQRVAATGRVPLSVFFEDDGAVGNDFTALHPAARECPELEEVWVEEIRRIAALEEPESRKMLYRDSLASLMSRAWGIAAERARDAAERAAEARARAVAGGDEVARERMSRFGEDDGGARGFDRVG